MIFLCSILYSTKEKHSLQADIKQKEIVSRGYIYETGYLYENESDYYSIDCGSGYISLYLSVGSDADIDMYLYDSSGYCVAYSIDYGYGVNEYLSYNCQPDIYTIEVYCYEVDPDGGYDYYYTLDGTYPDPGDPDLVVNSIIINETANPSDNTVYTPGWNPCSVTVTIENIGNANASGFDVALLYHDAETGWEELLDTEYVSEYLHLFQLFENVDIIAPVPLHLVKKRARGFNQAEFLSKEISIHMNCLHIPNLVLRNRFTDTQTKLNRKQRQENVSDAFTLNPKFEIQNKNILLIDDVFTTGATANSICKLLKKNHANKIYVLTIARAL